jgi:hypothetical protein
MLMKEQPFGKFWDFQAQLRAITLSKALKSTKSLKDVLTLSTRCLRGGL